MDWLLNAWLSVLTPWIGSAWNVVVAAAVAVAVAVVTVRFVAAVRFAVKGSACTRPGSAHHSTGSACTIGCGTSPVLLMATANQCVRWRAIRQPAPGAGPHENRHHHWTPV